MVARNVALAAAAVAIVAGEGSIAIGAGVAMAAVLLWRKAPVPAEGLPVGTRAPRFGALPGLLGARAPVLLVFASRQCGPCLELAPELEQWRWEYADRLTVEVLEREDDAVEAVFEAYQVDGTPAAILVDADGRIASSVAAGADAIRRLVTSGHAEPAGELPRREFLIRLAAAATAISPVLSFPARALAAAARPQKPYPPKPVSG